VHLEPSLMDTSVITEAEQKRQNHEEALENTYNTFVNLMKGHMNIMLKDRSHEYNIVSKVETYFQQCWDSQPDSVFPVEWNFGFGTERAAFE